ncbi:MAG TPA: M1 family aminopeptidase [Terriglobales bacterium]|nr:M1 family aminopeptidase [Terriglobales bacterium]
MKPKLILVVCALLLGFHAWAAPYPHDYNLTHVELHLVPNFARRAITADERLTARPLRVDFRELVLDCDGPEIDSVTSAGRTLPFQLGNGLLRIELPKPATAAFSVEIRYHLTPTAGLVFFPGDLATPDRATWLWASGEPNENHHWLPIYDRPNDKVTADFYITAPAGDWAIANGRLAGRRALAGGATEFHWQEVHPVSTYLLTFYVGHWNRIADRGTGVNSGVPLGYDVPPDESAEIARAEFGRTPEMMSYFSSLTGIPFPWEKYDQVKNPGFFSGLENASATEFPGDYPQNPTLANMRAEAPQHDVGISHELSHQWFGDFATCQDWSDLWLNEGFATFMQYTWDEHANGRDRAIADWESSARGYFRAAAAHDRPIVYANYGDPWSMFDAITYNKGGWAIRMLQAQLGDAAFWKAIHAYLSAYAYQPAGTENFELAFEQSTHQNLKGFFQRWFYGTGFPVFQAAWSWQPANGGQAVLRLHQTGDLIYTGPLTVALWSQGSERRQQISIQEATQSFRLAAPAQPEMILIDPDHTLLKQLAWTKSAAEWRYQAVHAPWSVDRESALDELARMARGSERAATASFLAARVGAEPVAAAADDALDRLAGLDPATAQRLALQRLQDGQFRVRADAAELLGNLAPGQAALPGEIRRLTRLFTSDPISSVRAAALEALLTVDRAHAGDYLQRALTMKSFEWQVEATALQHYPRIAGRQALPIEQAWAAPDRPAAARAAALAALGQLGSSDPRTLALLRQALAGPIGDTQIEAAFALARLHDRASLPAIERLANENWIGFFVPAFSAAAAQLSR